jgi:hypothetical protein
MVPGELERASANVHPLDVTDSRCLDCIDDEGVCRGAEEAVDLAGRCSLGTGIKGGDMAQIKQRISRTSGGSSVQRTLDWEQLRDNAKMFAWFAVATLVATAPRWIALLSISLSVTQAPMPAALEDFKSMWAPCKDPKNLFPAYSPGGQLYKSLATSNDFCTWMGASGFHMIALHVLFAVQGWGKGTWARTILLAGLLLHAAIVIATVGFPIQGHLALHRAGVGTGATFRDDAMMNQTKAVGRPAALQQADMSLKNFRSSAIARNFVDCRLCIRRSVVVEASRKCVALLVWAASVISCRALGRVGHHSNSRVYVLRQDL